MGILNYRIDRIDGKVSKRGADKVDVKEAFSIIEAKKKTDQMVNVKWGFDIDYQGIGKLSLEGSLDYVSKDASASIEEKEVKGKKLTALKGEALREVSNSVLRRGIIEAIILTKTLQLPPPIQLPSVRVEKDK
jgi:hypothetical protein